MSKQEHRGLNQNSIQGGKHFEIGSEKLCIINLTIFNLHFKIFRPYFSGYRTKMSSLRHDVLTRVIRIVSRYRDDTDSEVRSLP